MKQAGQYYLHRERDGSIRVLGTVDPGSIAGAALAVAQAVPPPRVEVTSRIEPEMETPLEAVGSTPHCARRAHSRHGSEQPSLGRRAHPGRTAQGRHPRRQAHRPALYAAINTSWRRRPALVDFPAQPCHVGHGLRADLRCVVPRDLRPVLLGLEAAHDRPCRGDLRSHGRVVRAAGAQCHVRRRGTAGADLRSRLEARRGLRARPHRPQHARGPHGDPCAGHERLRPNASLAHCDASCSTTFSSSARRTRNGSSPSSRTSTTRRARTRLSPSSSRFLERRRHKAASRPFRYSVGSTMTTNAPHDAWMGSFERSVTTCGHTWDCIDERAGAAARLSTA